MLDSIFNFIVSSLVLLSVVLGFLTVFLFSELVIAGIYYLTKLL